MAKPLKADVHPVTGEIMETPELRDEGLAQLRAAIAAELLKDKKFTVVRSDDQFLLAFLRARKYEVPRALKCLKSFCSFWYSNRAMLDGLSAKDVRGVYELGFMQLLPKDTKDVHGNAVTLLHMGKLDYSKFSPADLARLSAYTIVLMFEDDHMQRHGVTYIETMEGFSMMAAMSTAKHTGSKEQQKVLQLGLDTFPMRIRDIWLVKQPRWFNWFWGMVKYFFRQKLRDRLHLLGEDLAQLHTVVPADKLPPEFGGTRTLAPTAFFDELERREREEGRIGGFAVPLRVDDPTGEKRDAAAASAAAEAAASGSSSSSGGAAAPAPAAAPTPAAAPLGSAFVIAAADDDEDEEKEEQRREAASAQAGVEAAAAVPNELPAASGEEVTV